MYIPRHFEEPRPEILHQLMHERPLATLVTLGPQGLDANHIPLHFSAAENAPLGVLRGHVARANPLWREHPADAPVLAIFQGPDEYISPSWYATKAETGKVVPTWNYAVVHARGPLRVIDDPAWLRAQIEALTQKQEAAFARPWAVDDAPPDYVTQLLGAIVGIEITLTHLQGKWKVSQNQPEPNRAGVVRGLESRATDNALAMTRLVQAHDPIAIKATRK